MKNTKQLKTYEIEFGAMTYRTYYIDAQSKEEAEQRGEKALDEDFEVSKAWKQNAEVCYLEEVNDPHDQICDHGDLHQSPFIEGKKF